MQAPQTARATAAAKSVASAVGLVATDAVVLHNSNKLTLHLLPCDVVARVAPEKEQIAAFEVDLALRLAAAGGPVVVPDPRIHERDGFVITLWAHHESRGEPDPAGYVRALEQLHAAMRAVDVPAPHFTDRVGEAERLLADRALTPELPDDEREILRGALRVMGTHTGAPEQILHGEPHPGNLLNTTDGVLFVDLETCCRGPVEFDLAHAPDGIGELYPGVDLELLRRCRILMLAMIVTWRWDRGDQLPDGRRRGAEWFSQMRRLLR